MSTIQTQSGALGFVRRNTTPAVQIPDVQGSLATPGLEVAPPVSQGAQDAEAMLQAFSALGGASAAVLHTRNIAQAEQDRLDHIAKQNKAEVDAADRGQANIHAAADMPGIVARIGLGDLRPNDGESVRDFAKRIALDGTDGMSAEYRTQREKAITDNIAAALQNRLDKNRLEAEAANGALAVQSIDGATEAGQMTRAVSALRKIKPDLPEDVAIAEVGQRWLNNAVAVARVDPKQGTKILQAARAALGDRMQTEQATAQNLYDAAVEANQTKALTQLKGDVGKMLDAGAPYPTVFQFISEQGSKLGVDVHALRREVDTEHQVLHNRREADAAAAKRAADEAQRTAQEGAANQVAASILQGDYKTADAQARSSPKPVAAHFILGLVDQVRSHQAQAQRDAAEQLKTQQMQAFTHAATARAASLVEAGQGALIEDASIVLPDGTHHKITRGELRDTAMSEQFARVAEANKDNPEAAQSAVIKTAADNAYFPPGWKNLMDGAAGKITTAAIATSKDGKLPVDATQGYSFFKKLSAQAPGLLDTMSLSPRTTELFTAAMELEKTPMVGSDPIRALATAADIVDDPHSRLDQVKLSALANELDLSSQSDIEVAREAAPLAKILTRLGKTPEDAVKQAIGQVTTNRITINGWSSRVGNVPPSMRYQFADAAETKIEQYAKGLDGTGIDRSSLAFRYNDRTDLWEIVLRDTGIPAPTTNPGEVFFTTKQLVTEAKNQTEEAAKRKFLDRQRQIQSSNPFPESFLERLDAWNR